MNKKCIGCGAVLQEANVLKEGYTVSLENDICQRCFKIRHYGELETITKSNEEYINILKDVGKTNDLVLYVADLLNLEEDLLKIRNILPNPMILVLNKRDVIPLSVKDNKLIDYFKDLNVVDITIVSALKNYNIDNLYEMIKKYKTSNNVYVVGHTNAGKSSLINKFIKNYSTNTQEVTASSLPNTTLNTININIDNSLTLIDTPGLVDSTSIINYLDKADLKKVVPKGEIRPRVYQLRRGESIVIGSYVRIDYVEGDKNSFTLYISNNIKIKKLFNIISNNSLKDKSCNNLDIKYNTDLVINGLGFISIRDKCNINIYIDKEITYWSRKTIIGE